MNGRNFLYKSAVAASLAGFLFGFDTVVISGAEQKIQTLWQLNSGLHGLAISMALWGTVLGALTGGWPAQIFGRKKTLLWIGVLYLASAFGSAMAPGVYVFQVYRWRGRGYFHGGSTHVYFRNCTAGHAWPLNRNVPVQYCIWHSGGLSVQLAAGRHR
jgi:MFS family permease